MNDINFVFVWWIFFTVLGVIGIPVANLLFKKFVDSGFGLSKTLGILVLSYIIFILSTFHIIPFTRLFLFVVLFVYLGINLFIYSKRAREIKASVAKSFPLILLEELIFTAGFLLWAYVRSHQPDINGLEKFMDFGFINSILRSQYLPPIDMWFTGEAINYYWFGHLVTAVATKITGIPSAITYNFMLATILGLALSSSFSIITTLIYSFNKVKRIAVLGGLISAVLLNFAGNFHTPYYLQKEGKDTYWYPDATRFIGYKPETNDKTIHEFPIYSYVVSDLHAHLLDFPFVLLYLAVLYSWLINGRFRSKTAIIPGFVLGIMFMTNAWDFANYLLVTGFVILVSNLKSFKLTPVAIYKTAVPLIIIIISSGITVTPFVMNFKSIAEGVNFTHTKSPLWQMALLWGFPFLMSLAYLSRIKTVRIRKSDLFIISLLISSWTLILLPEFIFVKDIYIASHYRANTMFKLTYQAYVMFYLSAGYIAIRTIRSFRRVYQKFFASILFISLFASILYYPKIATYSYYGDLKNFKGLSGDTWLQLKDPDTYAAISWLMQNVQGQPTILEAPGDSYTEFNSISSYTGLPTVSGWYVHEWLWRGSPDFPQARVNEIVQIYTSDSEILTKSLLTKYKVKYVIVGSFERQKYPNLIENKFLNLGKVVFSSPSTKIYELL